MDRALQAKLVARPKAAIAAFGQANGIAVEIGHGPEITPWTGGGAADVKMVLRFPEKEEELV